MRPSAGSAPSPGSARAAHAVLAVVVAASLVLQVVLVLAGGEDASSGDATDQVPLGTRLVRLFSYFTIQSNVLLLVASASLAVRPGRDGRWWRVLRLDALLGILVTGIVFATVLAPIVEVEGAAAWANTGLHYVAPWAALLVWLVVGPRPRIDARTIALAFGWPVAWIAWTFLHGAITDWYPYPFLDAAAEGYAAALLGTGAVVVLAAVLVAALAALDQRLPRRVPDDAPPSLR
ncbi:Pr6Pr family membrane protein [Nocardioides zeae]|uniref:Pr6Pr family membrane protein n=1 Tax=Nocardioides imazamoxiresistens TaxID=3231893 RepID=A0ABU3PXV3_9ACTN|nr:Pr6Pr family membrane protein [Nocardioides zeae]MDT9594073.1 Pr6Pr family membrane protein [Nocardioides zeae]